MSSKRLRPAELVELVASIFAQIDNPRSLVACAQVNKLWADEATRYISERTPPPSALVALVDKDRLQIYTNKIRSLILHTGDRQHYALLSSVQFPRSTKLLMDDSDFNDERHLRHYLQPSLRHLSMGGGHVSMLFSMTSMSTAQT